MTTAEFYILLALADRERHGYAVMREVEMLSGGRVKLGPGTLYGALQRMLEHDWVEETDGPDDEMGADRRRFYRLAGAGRKALKAEASRLDEMVQVAQSKKVLRQRGPA